VKRHVCAVCEKDLGPGPFADSPAPLACSLVCFYKLHPGRAAPAAPVTPASSSSPVVPPAGPLAELVARWERRELEAKAKAHDARIAGRDLAAAGSLAVALAWHNAAAELADVLDVLAAERAS
jgi:hypothetical protein